jgi:hypothetical protein
MGSKDIYCWKNDTAGAVVIPNQPIANLSNLSLTGIVGAGGDSLAMYDGSTVYSVTGDNAVNAAAGWTVAEFNVFGPGGNSSGGSQASFNSGSSIVPRVRIIYGGTAPPNCVAQGFTGETNNLNFGPAAPMASAPGPALIFTESSAGGVTNCAAGTTIGDTHLTTFGGLLYDFQATGDFLLADTGADFLVQTRQVSGAPTWPNASVNKAVAMQSGKTRVAVCLAPNRVAVNGKPVQLAEGKLLQFPDGGDVVRTGNVYVVRGPNGDSARVVVNTDYIDVSMGLGRWPAKVRGLLANATSGKVNEIETRDGQVLTSPFAFQALYGGFTESWRVPPNQSLLRDCGAREIQGVPQKPFFANDLDPQIYQRARTACTQAGVKVDSLLNACTLDVAVIGRPAAARAFASAKAPVAVGNP